MQASRFICNLGAQTLQTSMMRMILQEIERHMLGIVGSCFRKDILEFCIHTDQDVFDLTHRRLDIMIHSLKSNKPAFGVSNKIILTPQEEMEYMSNPTKDVEGWKPTFYKTYFALPMQVNYAVESFQIPYFLHPDTPKLHILAELMSSNVLLREIREQGGAYGGGCNITPNGILNFYSYRDPHTLQTYQAFEKAIQWAVEGKMNEQDIKEAKLKVFSNVDQIESPVDKGLKEFIKGITDSMRSQYRKGLFEVTKDDILDVTKRYLYESIKEGKTSQVIFGTQGNDLESFLSRGWKIERPVEGLSVSEENYEQNVKSDPKLE